MGGEKGKKKKTYIQNELIFLKLCLNTKQTSLNKINKIFWYIKTQKRGNKSKKFSFNFV